MAVHPSCKKCFVPMQHGQYIRQTFTAGLPDFPSDTRGITLSVGGPGKLETCWKCPQCGYSLTIGTLKEIP